MKLSLEERDRLVEGFEKSLFPTISWNLIKEAYAPALVISSSCVPVSTTSPCCITAIESTLLMQSYEAMSISSRSSSLHFSHSRIRLSMENVIKYSCGKKCWFLVYQTNLITQPPELKETTVLFPEPLPPTTATVFPAGKKIEKSRKTITSEEDYNRKRQKNVHYYLQADFNFQTHLLSNYIRIGIRFTALGRETVLTFITRTPLLH
ncbi:hypothetical protein Leryth_019868 [Lithospermum erythrorhizon]|nr:hypothetical protein Leryth_019868 [Lithospermum erythrorhizon]